MCFIWTKCCLIPLLDTDTLPANHMIFLGTYESSLGDSCHSDNGGHSKHPAWRVYVIAWHLRLPYKWAALSDHEDRVYDDLMIHLLAHQYLNTKVTFFSDNKAALVQIMISSMWCKVNEFVSTLTVFEFKERVALIWSRRRKYQCRKIIQTLSPSSTVRNDVTTSTIYIYPSLTSLSIFRSPCTYEIVSISGN